MSAKGGYATFSGKLTPPLKWHIDGGKGPLATKIVALMPKHLHYVEPYAGGLSVLLAKDPEGISEVVNDLSLELTIFWRVLASEHHFPEFLRIVEATPFSEAAWKEAGEPHELGPYDICVPAEVTAAKFFIRCRQSLAGRMDTFSPLSRRRVRRGMNEQASAWLTAIEGLPAVHARLKRVVVLQRKALDVIRQQDGPQTLYYLDPPYHPDTRASKDVYEHEMSAADHDRLLELLGTIQGRFILSGYRCLSYDAAAEKHGWRRVDFKVANHAAGGEKKRQIVESCWVNYQLPAEAVPAGGPSTHAEPEVPSLKS